MPVHVDAVEMIRLTGNPWLGLGDCVEGNKATIHGNKMVNSLTYTVHEHHGNLLYQGYVGQKYLPYLAPRYVYQLLLFGMELRGWAECTSSLLGTTIHA